MVSLIWEWYGHCGETSTSYSALYTIVWPMAKVGTEKHWRWFVVVPKHLPEQMENIWHTTVEWRLVDLDMANYEIFC